MFLKTIFLIFITCLLAFCLSIMPMPDWANWFRPAWIILILAYWILAYPDYINIGWAWILGLLMDVLYGTILGEHAFALTITAYLIYRMRRDINRYPLMQQSIFIIILSYVYTMILFSLQWMLGQGLNDWRFWLSPLLTIILWPVIVTFLQKIQRRFRIS